MRKPDFQTTIYMTPRPQERARSTGRGKHHYTPAKSRVAATDIKTQLLAKSPPFFKGPLAIKIKFYFSRPKSVTRAKRPHHTVKPDITNLTKLVEDATNGVLWQDDCQICSMLLTKCYIEKDHKNQRPRVEFTLWKYGNTLNRRS